ncbi:lipopolysaccharide biosynthesis protein [Roseiconus nitratireducens]|uniref:lipopolysaccharide biosynthesis protein n=1 Tax=Roseiconus nitratireducens TaxID=2605748 RepID=UPI001375C68C|nr:lipopolysaccharide biosynthesis protein [Roseiconus nitratireducens]
MPSSSDHDDFDRGSFAADSLATGFLVMLAMTVVQRSFGFFRGIWFCRLLEDASVGQWAMAFGFITMISPIMLLGMPGSLPRYVEHYRVRGHLRAFVRRLGISTAVCAVLFSVAVAARPAWFGWLIFLQPDNLDLVRAVGIAVIAIIAFYFVGELVSALRQVRVVSLMQFTQSVTFTFLGIGWLVSGGGIVGLVLVFALATLLAIAPGMRTLVRGWKGLPQSEDPFDASVMWRRIVPYASAIWAMDVLANLFEMSDRYMILHLSPGGDLAGQAAVGQYHSGRMIPVLLISLASMLSGVLLPYLSADWEAGRQTQIPRRLRWILTAVSASFTLGAALALLAAPTMFETLLENRYQAGLTVLPMAFTFCIWSALVTIAQNYLWVVERGHWVAAALGVGLIANLGFNAALLPVWGLQGAVVATLASHGIVLVGIWFALRRWGYDLDRTTLYASLWPAALLAGPWVAIACVLATLTVSGELRSIFAEAGIAQWCNRWAGRWRQQPDPSG